MLRTNSSEKKDHATAVEVALSEAREEYLKARKTIIQIITNTKVISMLNAISIPRVVATPFPH